MCQDGFVFGDVGGTHRVGDPLAVGGHRGIGDCAEAVEVVDVEQPLAASPTAPADQARDEQDRSETLQ